MISSDLSLLIHNGDSTVGVQGSWVGNQGPDHRGKEVRGVKVVIVANSDVMAGRPFDPGIQVSGHAETVGVPVTPDTRVIPGGVFDSLCGAVSPIAVVTDQNLEVAPTSLQKRAETIANLMRAAVSGHHYADGGSAGRRWR